MARPIAAVLFDFGGTLDADGLRWAVRFHEAYRAGGGRLDLPGFEPLFRESDVRLARHPEIRRSGFRAMVRLQSGLLAGLVPDGRGVDWDEVATRFFEQAEATVRRNGSVLERLGRRYRMGVVSNFTGNLVPCLEELDLARHFEVVIDSAVEGREKPDPHPFLAALAALGIPPDAGWMVGDNPEADIRPALLLGLSACWLADPARPLPRGLLPTARIASLCDIDQALETACTA